MAATMTDSGLLIPDFGKASTVRRFCNTMDERASREAQAFDNAAVYWGVEFDSLPGVSQGGRFGKAGGTRALRHVRYMANLSRQMAKASDAFWEDYNALVLVPWRIATKPRDQKHRPDQ